MAQGVALSDWIAKDQPRSGRNKKNIFSIALSIYHPNYLFFFIFVRED